MVSHRSVVAAALAALPVAAGSFGQTAVSFVGPPGGAWHSAANWQPVVVPDNNPGAVPPVFYTVSIDRPVIINGGLFDIAGMTNSGSVDSFSSWDFAGPAGSPFLHNTGTLSVVPPVASSAYIGIQPPNTLSITGGGTVRLGGAGSARLIGGGTLINQDNTIRGEGSIGEGVLNLNNHGVIAATDDNLADGTLTVFPGPGGLTNTNTLQARNMGNLLLRGVINNTGGTILADNGGTVHFVASPQITGGTIASAAGGITVVSSTTRWIGLAHAARTFVPSTLDVMGTLANTGTINVSGTLRIDTAATIADDGTIILSGAIARAGANPATLVNRNVIRGFGNLGVNSLTISNLDTGQIQAEASVLTINPGVNGLFTNTGTLLAISGGTLVLNNGGGGGTFLNDSGNIHAGLESVVRLDSARITGGTISSAGGTGFGRIFIPTGSTSRLSNVETDARFEVQTGGVLEFENNIGGGASTLQVNGGAMLRIVNSATMNLGNISLRPGAAIQAGTPSFGESGPEAGAVLYNGCAIRGSGTIGVNDLQIINNGTITGDGGGAELSNPLALDPSGKGLLNAGIIEAVDLGVVILNGGTGGFTQNGTAVIRATDPGSNVQLINAFVSGGQLGAGGGSISAGGGGAGTLESLTSDANLVQSGVGQIVISQNVVNTGTISTPGVAAVVVAASSTLNSASGHHVNQGTISISGGGFADFQYVENISTLSLGRIIVATNGTMMAHSIDQGSLSIGDHAFGTLKASFAPGVDGSIVGSLSIGTIGAALDVTNRGMAVTSGSISTIAAQITSGYAGGAWNGTGIRSSSAAANAGFGVGYAVANQVGSPATFLGRPVTPTSVLFRYTRLGDANLDATVNIADFALLASNFNTGTSLWSRGNFNYDGTVNIADFALLAGNFNLGVPMTPLRAVPEAGAAMLFLLPLAWRRWRGRE